MDYLGIPLSEEGRARALAYDSSLLTVPEHACMRHPSQYSFWGPAAPRIGAEYDEELQLIAYTVVGTFRRADRTIYMDGRPHPSAHAPHTWAGFTTGTWRGDTLVTTTTHLKWGWIRRNGVRASDQSTLTTFYTRNGNVLTITWMVHDPLYLTETYVKSADFVLRHDRTRPWWQVTPVDETSDYFFQCFPREEIRRTTVHDVPHYLPGGNPFLSERANQLGIPMDAALGGADTASPEYRERLGR